MSRADSHLRRILARSIEAISDEVLNCASLAALYPEIGQLHPAVYHEAHAQHLLFAGLRLAGYMTIAEANYFAPADNGRRLDLAVWLPDARRWLYLEIEPCGPLYGYQNVLEDATKLVTDDPTDPRNRMRGVLVYGFRDPVTTRDGFRRKYENMSTALVGLGFTEIEIRQRSLDGAEYQYVQAGLWVLGLEDPKAPGGGTDAAGPAVNVAGTQ